MPNESISSEKIATPVSNSNASMLIRQHGSVLEVPGLGGTIIGVDLSLSSTGLAIIQAGWLNHAEKICFEGDDLSRAIKISERIIIACRLYAPIAVIIEGQAFYAVGNAKTRLAELAGIVKYRLHVEEFPFFIVSPVMIKSFIVGYGHKRSERVKTSMIQAVRERWGIDFSTPPTGKQRVRQEATDECDAFCLATLGWYYWAWKSLEAPGRFSPDDLKCLDQLSKGAFKEFPRLS